MLIMENQSQPIEDIRNLMGNTVSKYYFQTTNPVTFMQSDRDFEKYFGEFISFPNKSFAFAYIAPLFFNKLQIMSKSLLLVTKGLVFKGSTPYQMNLLLEAIDSIHRSNSAADKVKEINKKIKDTYEERVKSIKDTNKERKKFNKDLTEDTEKNIKFLNKESKKFNKDLKASWEKALEKAPEDQRQFMPEPVTQYKEILEMPDLSNDIKSMKDLPDSPNFRDVPYSKSFSIEGLHRTHSFAWRILSKFEFLRIEDTKDFVFLRKRKSELSYKEENLLKLNVSDTIKKEDFLAYVRSNELNDPRFLDNYRQDVSINQDLVDMYSIESNVFENDIYEEETVLLAEKEYQPLAPVKPQQQASMISGLKVSKVINTDKGQIILKSAPVKVFYTRNLVVGNKEVTETVEKYEDVMSIYNIDERLVEEL